MKKEEPMPEWTEYAWEFSKGVAVGVACFLAGRALLKHLHIIK